MSLRRLSSQHPDWLPLAALLALSFFYWSKVLCTNNVLLPGEFLKGFAPFGAQPTAPWNILQWDGLAQYYPWRLCAARQLHVGLLPLWNPYQFAGAPLLANGQSAVFYPLNVIFWIVDPARAFGWSAFIHSFLAAAFTYGLARHWGRTRAAALFAGIAFGFGGYLSAWAMLPTLANTASWLPVVLLLLEHCLSAEERRLQWLRGIGLAAALFCALTAGHAQIFFYLLVALILRALFLKPQWKALMVVVGSTVFGLGCGALQLLPTLELASLGHRAAQGGATPAGWNFWLPRSLHSNDLLSLVVPAWPMGSTNENFGYIGIVCALFAAGGCIAAIVPSRRASKNSTPLFALILTVFGLLYAMATPLSELFYFHIPGLSQMGGFGRALLLWSLGAALLAAHGLDFLRSKIKSELLPLLALGLVTLEPFAAGWSLHPIASRADIYPATALTNWLQANAKDGERILFITPRHGWLPAESRPDSKYHPPGILPPNGAMVYGLHDISGYDSLAPRAYRTFVAGHEGEDVSPPYNGNMILLNNPDSSALPLLNVRYIVSQTLLVSPLWKEKLHADGCVVYERVNFKPAYAPHFYPGWRSLPGLPDHYEPETFRFGLFLSLCCVAVIISTICILRRCHPERSEGSHAY